MDPNDPPNRGLPPAGWYPADGGTRWWDGFRWTGHFAPADAANASPQGEWWESSAVVPDAPAVGNVRPGPAAWFGWGGLVLVALVGLTSSGVSGFLMMSGLYVLVVAVVALVRGRVAWARLRGRAAGGIALGAALALMIAGVAIADPPAAPPVAAPAASPTPTATPTPTPTRSATKPTPSPKSAEQGTALAAVASLKVKGRAPKTGYSRDHFGRAWFDADRNGCDTRNDILRRDLTAKDMKNDCKVLAGTLDPDPFTGTKIRFEYGGPSEVDIDHLVALGDAWQKGAGAWAAEKRLAFANDPLNLLAVQASANRSKGDGDAATWLPSNTSFRCEYVARQVAVKSKYKVWVTAAERDAMVRVLSSCPKVTDPTPGPAPTEAALPKSAKKSPPTPRSSKAPSSVYYANCTEVRAAGAAPILAGQPGYSRKLDRDGDGIACE